MVLTPRKRQSLIFKVISLSPICLHARDRMDGVKAGKIVDMLVAEILRLQSE